MVLPEYNIGANLGYFGLGDNFSDKTQKALSM